ncbi:MAG: hypothetical protein ACFFAN_11635 [Promethearchaeota archaeon]
MIIAFLTWGVVGIILGMFMFPLFFLMALFLPLGFLVIYYEIIHIKKTKELQKELDSL